MQIITISNHDIRLIKTAIQCHIEEMDLRNNRFGVFEKLYDEIIEDYSRLLREIENVEKTMK